MKRRWKELWGALLLCPSSNRNLTLKPPTELPISCSAKTSVPVPSVTPSGGICT